MGTFSNYSPLLLLLLILRPWAMLHQCAETTAWVLLHPPTWTAKWPAPGELPTPTPMVRLSTHAEIPLSACITLRNFSSSTWISWLNRPHDRVAWLCEIQARVCWICHSVISFVLSHWLAQYSQCNCSVTSYERKLNPLDNKWMFPDLDISEMWKVSHKWGIPMWEAA